MLAITYIPFSKDQRGHVKKVLTALSKQDTSFRFWIKKEKRPGPEYFALIRSYSLDQAHRRGLLITRRYLNEIQPPLSYKAFEASLPAQVNLASRSLRVLSDTLSLSLLVMLRSVGPVSLEELSRTLGISALRLKSSLRRLVEAGTVAIVNRKVALTDQGLSLLVGMERQKR